MSEVTNQIGASPRRNPFAASRVRPGAIDFLFGPETSAASVVDRLRAADWWGQITGPHGSGKSTLVATLVPVLIAAGRAPKLITLRDQQRHLPLDFRASEDLSSASIIIVDGYEQLSRLARWRLRRFCRRLGCGLLVTAHEPVGLPRLYETQVDIGVALRVVERLQRGQCDPFVDEGEVRTALERHHGDLRETLFELYDLFESRARDGARESN